MASSESRSIHPFFVRPLAKPALDELDQDDGCKREHRRNVAAGDPDNPLHAERPPSDSSVSVVVPTTIVSSLSNVDGKVRATNDADVGKALEQVDSDTLDRPIEDDPNFQRRKRRKVIPVITHDQSWLEQLRAAATKDDIRGDLVSQPSSTVAAPSVKRDRDKHTPTQMPACLIDEADTTTSPHSNKENEVAEDIYETQSVGPSVRDDIKIDPAELESSAQPPRKVLRLNGRGGFGSPVAQRSSKVEPDEKADQESSPKRRGLRPPTSRIVMIYYGQEDEPKRKELADRIQRILSSGSLKTTSNSEHNPALETQKPPALVPSKPTHPFFLGKVQPKEDIADRSGSRPSTPPLSGSHVETKEIATPSRRSYSTPGKLKHQASLFQAVSREPAPKPTSATSSHARTMGTVEPPWPPKGCTRIEPRDLPLRLALREEHMQIPFRDRRKKQKTMFVDLEEDLIQAYAANLRKALSDASRLQSVNKSRQFPLPQKKIAGGCSLAEQVRKNILEMCNGPNGGGSARNDVLLRHPTILRMLRGMENSQSAFDVGECEPQTWTQKYSPNTASEVLQAAKEVQILKSWLQGLTVDAVENSSTQKPETQERLLKKKKKRRKKSDDLDDFVVSSDDELSEMQDISDNDDPTEQGNFTRPRSTVRVDNAAQHSTSGKRLNAILLSGPHGSGKSAAAHAVAKELGFDVFEINPGSRRSGKDILEKVGDMSLNHQVSKSEVNSSEAQGVEISVADEQQSSLKAFFGAKKPASKSATSKKKSLAKQKDRVTQAKPKPKKQKQAVILLEEVDILFEDDKQFWDTIVELSSRSRRPIIMTCNSEASVPVDDLPLHGVLRFRPPPLDLTVAYLLLVTAREGHFLSHESIRDLLEANRRDLRATLTTLNFWCQMAVGDDRGGMDWMLTRWPPGVDVDEHGHKKRVISCDTFVAGMGMLSSNCMSDAVHLTDDLDAQQLRQLWEEWHMDPTEVSSAFLDRVIDASQDCWHKNDRRDNLDYLSQLDSTFYMFSSIDVSCHVDLPSSQIGRELLDASRMPPIESQFPDFVTGHSTLHAEVKKDWTQTDTEIASWIHSQMIRDCSHSQEGHNADLWSHLVGKITNPKSGQNDSRHCRQSLYTSVSEPLLTATRTSLSLLSFDLDPSFYHEPRVMIEDVAPYVRCIADFDLELEQRRSVLDNLLSQDGQRNKRVRTTRASRSALEGSQRAITRRERWFPKAMQIDLDAVLKTGGHGWPRLKPDRAEPTDPASLMRSATPPSSLDS